ESSPTSPTKHTLPLQQVKETGALPQPATSTNNVTIEKNKTIKKGALEKGSPTAVKTSSYNRTCVQCSNDEIADKYWTKIIRQAQKHVSNWWSSLKSPKKT
ncbi:MAG: hypothetical protein ACKOW3_08045, partial [Hyphomicrobium sp.]